ncbi:hypothetical protein G7046_g6145 [Stylonectria norvegica]|nr:hypothetical protein G7046_g6145 [Stylonectria norvegica]
MMGGALQKGNMLNGRFAQSLKHGWLMPPAGDPHCVKGRSLKKKRTRGHDEQLGSQAIKQKKVTTEKGLESQRLTLPRTRCQPQWIPVVASSKPHRATSWSTAALPPPAGRPAGPYWTPGGRGTPITHTQTRDVQGSRAPLVKNLKVTARSGGLCWGVVWAVSRRLGAERWPPSNGSVLPAADRPCTNNRGTLVFGFHPSIHHFSPRFRSAQPSLTFSSSSSSSSALSRDSPPSPPSIASLRLLLAKATPTHTSRRIDDTQRHRPTVRVVRAPRAWVRRAEYRKGDDSSSDVFDMSKNDLDTMRGNSDLAQAGGTGTTGTTGDGDGRGSTDETTVVIFGDQFVNDPVFEATVTKVQKLSFQANESVTLEDLVWFAKRYNETKDYEKVTSLKFDDKPKSPIDAISDTSVTIDVDMFSAETDLTKWLGGAMRLQISWSTQTSTGTSNSTLFSIVDGQNPSDTNAAHARLGNATFTGDDPAENIISKSEDTTVGGDGTSSSTGDAGPSSPSSTASSDSSSHKSGGGGLAKGAIAGIAVGAVVGALLLIGGLIWFFLRRRRQNKGAKSKYDTTQSSNTFMVDKEIPARTTDSPNSPYSDDNQTARVPLEEISVARDGHSPYQDAPVAGTAAAAAVPRTSSTRSRTRSRGAENSGATTPQGRTNVSHLVEEGMTPAEIQRLEEEERQLDDEIERAGRR